MLDIDDPTQLDGMDSTGLFGRAASLAARPQAARQLAQTLQSQLQPPGAGPLWLLLPTEWAGVGRSLVHLCARPGLLWAGDVAPLAQSALPGHLVDLSTALDPRLHPAQVFLALALLLAEWGWTQPLALPSTPPAWAEAWTTARPTLHNPAKQLAQQLVGRAALFWGDGLLAGVAQSWQIRWQLYAEGAAFHLTSAELAASQIMARFPRFWPQAAALVHLDLAQPDPAQAAQAQAIQSLFRHRRMTVLTVVGGEDGHAPVMQVWRLLELGEWVALYGAALNQVDPAEETARRFLAGAI